MKKVTSKFIYIFIIQAIPHLSNAQFIIISPIGIHSTNVAVYPTYGYSVLHSMAQVASVQRNQTVLMDISSSILPGEFIIRYDYRVRETDSSYPSEQRIMIGVEGVSFEIDPTRASEMTSIRWRSGSLENLTWDDFLMKRRAWQAKLVPIRKWLEAEDNTRSKIYKIGCKEFEQRRRSYHRWLDSFRTRHSELFVSHLMPFASEPPLARKGNPIPIPPKALLSKLDLRDSLIVRSSVMYTFFNTYLSSLSSKDIPEDSIRVRIHRVASEILDLSKYGHPTVRGWIVDYLYDGFLASGMDSSIPMLAPMIKDLGSYSRRSVEIFRKTMAMGRVAIGLKVPDFIVPAEGQTPIPLSSLLSQRQRTLLLFWSVTCPHCTQLVDSLVPYSQDPKLQERLQVIAISIDRSDADAVIWGHARQKSGNWTHAICREGVNSDQARLFGVLATPMMFLLAGKEGIIEAMPDSFTQLKQIMDRSQFP